MRFSFKLAVMTFSFLIFLLFFFECRSEAGEGTTAPDFSLSSLSGNMTSLKQYRGSVVLLDFWATWCPPCMMSIPELVELQKKYRHKGLVILGISIDDPRKITDRGLRAFGKKVGINYTILRFNNRVLQDYFGNRAISIPTMFIIDREGKIRRKHVGYSPGAVEKSLVGLLK